MNISERAEFLAQSRKIIVDGKEMDCAEFEFTYGKQLQRPKIIQRNTTNSEYDHLYITDELISGRIQWEHVPAIKITYYTTDDIHIPWWKFWIDKCEMVNIKNKQLWEEAMAVAHAKHMPPVVAPLVYRRF
jgi:hypothetical protein